MEKPNYYSILIAEVRYDKRLKANEKLLYSEITCLTNSNGYCHASNGYFADLYSVSKVSISNWIKNLIKYGYIKSTIKYKDNSKEIEKRYLELTNRPIKEILNTPKRKVYDPIKENFNTPIKENFKDNNTSINITSLINKVDFEKKNIFELWINYRKEIKKTIKSETTLKSLIKKINGKPLKEVEQVINTSIENGWQGLFWDKLKNNNTKKSNYEANIEANRNRSWNQ
jgi:hypothetical protein